MEDFEVGEVVDLFLEWVSLFLKFLYIFVFDFVMDFIERVLYLEELGFCFFLYDDGLVNFSISIDVFVIFWERFFFRYYLLVVLFEWRINLRRSCLLMGIFNFFFFFNSVIIYFRKSVALIVLFGRISFFIRKAFIRLLIVFL